MGLARATYSDAPTRAADDTALVEAMVGRLRRVRSLWLATFRRHCASRAWWWTIRQSAAPCAPRVRGRYVTTTNSDHGGRTFPNLAKDIVPGCADQLWVADLTYVPVTGGFVYVAIIPDAGSRRVVGYALGRSIAARSATMVRRALIGRCRPPTGLTRRTDRGSQ